jgi:hypothetical protein
MCSIPGIHIVIPAATASLRPLGEREGPRRDSGREGEVVGAANCLIGPPHPSLSPRPASDRRGERNRNLAVGVKFGGETNPRFSPNSPSRKRPPGHAWRRTSRTNARGLGSGISWLFLGPRFRGCKQIGVYDEKSFVPWFPRKRAPMDFERLPWVHASWGRQLGNSHNLITAAFAVAADGFSFRFMLVGG